MATSSVYFTDMRSHNHESLPHKLVRLIEAAGFNTIDFEGKFAAIKIHFGEPGNLSYLRPNYAKTVVDKILALGGKPFLTDCNTLYAGRRKNALEHLESAYENGFSPFSAGCHIIIADGLRGLDETLVPVNGDYVKEAKIGSAIMDADIFISLSHFKGHEMTGFGGALKNIGMGCGSRAGKKEMHSSGKPSVNPKKCVGCGRCVRSCAHSAIKMTEGKAAIDQTLCVGCGRCIGMCGADAISAKNDEGSVVLNRKIAEYSAAVLRGRPNFHINLVIDVSPECDCHGDNDAPIVPNIGFFASFDPVALDQACVDAVNAQTAFTGSVLHTHQEPGDHFTHAHPETNWASCLEHAEKLGLGSRNYELITVK